MNILTLKNVCFSTKSSFWKPTQHILRGVDFSVNSGEIFGFLGTNGAGKTTTIKSILGLLKITQGSIRIFDNSIKNFDVRKRIGFMPERAYFPDYLKGIELVKIHALLTGLSYKKTKKRSFSILEKVGLADSMYKKINTYSKGMLQRLGIAQALIGEPDLMIFDEPMSGLDPLGCHDIRNLMYDFRKQGKTIFFSTHILPDVELICDRVAILSKGVITATGTLDELLKDTQNSFHVTTPLFSQKISSKLLPYVDAIDTHGQHMILKVIEQKNSDKVIDILRNHHISIIRIENIGKNLESVFLDEISFSKDV